jgi:hypothetical protein
VARRAVNIHYRELGDSSVEEEEKRKKKGERGEGREGERERKGEEVIVKQVWL